MMDMDAAMDAGDSDGGESDDAEVDGGDSDAGDDGGQSDGGQVDDGGASGEDGGVEIPIGDVTFAANCPETAVCGGAFDDGLYYYSNLCINDNGALAALRLFCIGAPVEAGGTVEGTIEFRDGTITRDVTVILEGSIDYRPNCEPPLDLTCQDVEDLLASFFGDATCTDDDGCDCEASGEFIVQDVLTYDATVESPITTNEGVILNYCVDAPNIELHQAGDIDVATLIPFD